MLTLTFGEMLDESHAPSNFDFEVEVRGAERSISGTPTVSGATVTMHLTAAVLPSDTVRVRYVEFSTPLPRVGVSFTATLVDPDTPVTELMWQWQSSTSSNGVWGLIDGADSRIYTPAEADLGRYLRATATYTDTAEPQATRMARAVTGGAVQQ